MVGEYLSSVTFVMDYLQVDFCGSSFNFYNWPIIALIDRKLESGEPDYRNELCRLIGKTVKSIDVFLDTGLTFEFQGGEVMTVSLRAPAGSTLPEVSRIFESKEIRDHMDVWRGTVRIAPANRAWRQFGPFSS